MHVVRCDPQTVTFVIELRLNPGCGPDFLDLLSPVLDAMRHEPTFVNAVLHRDPDNPLRFMLYETWTSLDDVVQVQMHRGYRRAYWDGLPALLAEDRTVQVWQPVRGDFAMR